MRRGGSCLGGYVMKPFSSIELACAVRQPGPCVRALCEPVALLLSKNMSCARPRCNATPSEHFLHTSHFTLHSSHPALHTSHLFSPHLNSSHLIPSRLTCHLSKFFSTVFISSEHWSTFLISSKFASTHLSCSARQQALTVREKSLAQKKTMGAESFRTQKLETQMHLHRKALPKYFVPQSLHKALPSTTLYYKACTKHFPVLLCTTRLAHTHYFPVLPCTTKLARSTSQYYLVLQSLHKALPSTTLYYKACTKHFPVLLCTT